VRTLRECRIQVQGDILQIFQVLHASRNWLATIRMLIPPSVAIHGDVDAWVTGRWRLGVGGMVAVGIPRVLRVGLHNNWHIRAMMRDEIGSRVRHSAVGNVRRVILVVRGKRVSLTLMVLPRMRRRGRLHRYIVRGVVRTGFSRLVHRWDRTIDRERVTHRTHERRSRGRASGRWHSSE